MTKKGDGFWQGHSPDYAMEINTLRQTCKLFGGQQLQAEMGEPCPELFGFNAVKDTHVLTTETQHQFGFGGASRVEGSVGQVFAVDDAV